MLIFDPTSDASVTAELTRVLDDSDYPANDPTLEEIKDELDKQEALLLMIMSSGETKEEADPGESPADVERRRELAYVMALGLAGVIKCLRVMQRWAKSGHDASQTAEDEFKAVLGAMKKRLKSEGNTTAKEDK